MECYGVLGETRRQSYLVAGSFCYRMLWIKTELQQLKLQDAEVSGETRMQGVIHELPSVPRERAECRGYVDNLQ